MCFATLPLRRPGFWLGLEGVELCMVLVSGIFFKSVKRQAMLELVPRNPASGLMPAFAYM